MLPTDPQADVPAPDATPLEYASSHATDPQRWMRRRMIAMAVGYLLFALGWDFEAFRMWVLFDYRASGLAWALGGAVGTVCGLVGLVAMLSSPRPSTVAAIAWGLAALSSIALRVTGLVANDLTVGSDSIFAVVRAGIDLVGVVVVNVSLALFVWKPSRFTAVRLHRMLLAFTACMAVLTTARLLAIRGLLAREGQTPPMPDLGQWLLDVVENPPANGLFVLATLALGGIAIFANHGQAGADTQRALADRPFTRSQWLGVVIVAWALLLLGYVLPTIQMLMTTLPLQAGILPDGLWVFYYFLSIALPAVPLLWMVPSRHWADEAAT